MAITIKRDTGLAGSASNIKIMIDGDAVGSVADKKQVEVELPNGKAKLKVKQLGIKSNEIEVEDGDYVEINQSKWGRTYWSVFIGIPLIISFINLISSWINSIIAMGIIFVAYIISLFLIDGFDLKKID